MMERQRTTKKIKQARLHRKISIHLNLPWFLTGGMVMQQKWGIHSLRPQGMIQHERLEEGWLIAAIRGIN